MNGMGSAGNPTVAPDTLAGRIAQVRIERPRVQALLGQTLGAPVVAVVAGPRCGKTIAVNDLCAQLPTPVLQMRTSRLDNVPAQLWRKITAAMKGCDRECGAALAQMCFPASQQETGALAAVLSQTFSPEYPLLWTVDDFQNIEDAEVYRFFQQIADARIPGVTLMIISDTRRDIDLGGSWHEDTDCAVGAPALRFTEEELAALFAAYDLPSTPQQRMRLLEKTGGWAYAAHLLVQQRAAAGRPEIVNEDALDLGEALSFLGKRWFLPYSAALRSLLIKLSLLPFFSLEIMLRIGGVSTEKVEALLRNNMLIEAEDNNRYFRLHPLYHQYLTPMQSMLSQGEASRVHLVAGRWYEANGHPGEAIASYVAGREYVHAYTLATSFCRQINRHAAGLLLEHMDQLPLRLYMDKPFANLLRANLLLLQNRPEEAKRMLRVMETFLLEADSPQEMRLLGEVYASLTDAYLLCGDTRALVCIEKASRLLPDGSSYRFHEAIMLPSESTLVLHGNMDLDEYARLIASMTGYRQTVFGNAVAGSFELYHARLAMTRLDLDRALMLSARAAEEALYHQQYRLAAYALMIRFMAGLLQGDINYVTDAVAGIDSYVSQFPKEGFGSLRDCMIGLFLIKTDNLDRVPAWIKIRRPMTETLDTMTDYELLLQPIYHLAAGDYPLALSMLLSLERMAVEKRHVLTETEVYVLQALTYAQMGDMQQMAERMRAAYRLSKRYGILAPFIAHGEKTRTVISSLRRLNIQGMDEAWLSNIYAKSSTCAKHIRTLARAYDRLKNAGVQNARHQPLSPREEEVLMHLIQGLTRQEVADYMDISINSVRQYIASMFSKLGARSLPEAVYIATVGGLVTQVSGAVTRKRKRRRGASGIDTASASAGDAGEEPA